MLGKGTFGVVHTVKDHPTLAVKEIWLKGQPDRLVEITKFELETMSKFSHLGVLKYHQVIEDGDFFYIVMDRYSSDLEKFIAKHRKNSEPIPRELMRSILKQLAEALAYVHAPRKVSEKGDVLPGRCASGPQARQRPDEQRRRTHCHRRLRALQGCYA